MYFSLLSPLLVVPPARCSLLAAPHLAVRSPARSLARRGACAEVCYPQAGCPTGAAGRPKCFQCIPTIAEAVARVNGAGVTTSAAAVDINSTNASSIDAAIALARAADVVVLALGIDKTIEYETHDRPDTALPGLQSPFALRVLALGKPTVMVLINGGALAIDELLIKRTAPYAIVEAFNPNVIGGVAVADALFGKVNRWGKLPVTMYPHAFIKEKSMIDYDMSSGVGRTYRYYKGTPLFTFVRLSAALSILSHPSDTHHWLCVHAHLHRNHALRRATACLLRRLQPRAPSAHRARPTTRRLAACNAPYATRAIVTATKYSCSTMPPAPPSAQT